MEMSEMNVDDSGVMETTRWGSRLREAREARGLSLERVASELRLGVKLLRAVENEDVDALPTPPFVKGYLRGYARLLEMDSDAIVQAYGVDCGVETPTITRITQMKETTSNDNWPRYATWGVIAVIVVSFLIWWSARILTSNGQEAATSAPAPAVEAPVASPLPQVTIAPLEPEPEPDTAIMDDVVAAEPEADAVSEEPPQADVEPAAQAAAEPEAPPVSVAAEGADEPAVAPPAGQGPTVTLDVSEDSWVEIIDAEGQRLFFDLARAGTRSTVAGVPPYKIILGNAKGVALLYNGEPFDTTPFQRKGVARLTLGE